MYGSLLSFIISDLSSALLSLNTVMDKLVEYLKSPQHSNSLSSHSHLPFTSKTLLAHLGLVTHQLDLESFLLHSPQGL